MYVIWGLFRDISGDFLGTRSIHEIPSKHIVIVIALIPCPRYTVVVARRTKKQGAKNMKTTNQQGPKAKVVCGAKAFIGKTKAIVNCTKRPDGYWYTLRFDKAGLVNFHEDSIEIV